MLDAAIAYYKFDETSGTSLKDEKGSHNGTINNNPTLNEDGLIGRAIRFGNGSSDQSVSLSDSNDFSFTNGVSDKPFSISTWVKPSASFGSMVAKYSNTNSDREYKLYASSGTVFFTIHSEGSESDRLLVRTDDSPFASDSTWRNIIVTYDGSSLEGGLLMYYNGGLQESGFAIGNYVKMINTNQDVIIANQTGNSNVSLNAEVDETAIFNRVLTQSEVNEIYNGGSGMSLD